MKVTLRNVRLSFPDLFKPKSIGNSEPKYGASFIFEKGKDDAQLKTLTEAIVSVINEKWPKAEQRKGLKYCLHDGEKEPKDYAGYGPHMKWLSASNAMQPALVDEDVEPILDNRKMYAGCIVNASIRLWAQDNDFGKRINAQLNAVQFVSEGEAFGEKPIDPKEEFQPVRPSSAPSPKQAPPSGDVDTSLADDQIPF